MATFCKLLSARGRVNWWKLCKEFDVKPEQPVKDERRIHFQGKLEDVGEIDRLIRQPGRGAWHG